MGNNIMRVRCRSVFRIKTWVASTRLFFQSPGRSPGPTTISRFVSPTWKKEERDIGPFLEQTAS